MFRHLLVPSRLYLQCARSVTQRRTVLSVAVNRKMERMVKRREELMEQMMQQNDRFRDGKELASLSHVSSLDERLKALDEELTSLQELLDEAKQAKDADLQQDCEQEIQSLHDQKDKVEQRILQAIIPKDEDDTMSNTILEIRAGTGGDEACLFASELLDAYQKSAKALNYTVETLSENRTDLGGIREALISITSKGGGSFGFAGGNVDFESDIEEEEDFRSTVGPYGMFKFESGVHRVQRVPINDSKIHTSACSVAALPLLQQDNNNDSKDLLPMSELKIETMRSSGAGGQSVNTTDSAVRITHLPTGIVASIQDERSQHQNRDKAMKLIAARVRDRERAEQERERGATRSALMGGGDRSERIRTYNFPQDRVTDHRCKHSTHGIANLLAGSSEDGLVVTFYPFLRSMHKDELLQQLEDEEAEIDLPSKKGGR